jgi:hypothetical protein
MAVQVACIAKVGGLEMALEALEEVAVEGVNNP